MDFYGAPLAVSSAYAAVIHVIDWGMGGSLFTNRQNFWGSYVACMTPGAAFCFVICGLAPRRLQVMLSSFMHKLKGTHSQPVSKRKFNFHKIRPNLFLGRQFRDVNDIDTVAKCGVKAVVALNEEWELFVKTPQVVSRLSELMSNPHSNPTTDLRLRVNTPDYQAPSLQEMIDAVIFIETHIQQGNGVYVHCNAGKGRSSVVVACYLMYSEQGKYATYADVIKHMRSIRPDVSFGLLDWPFRSQARAVSRFFEYMQGNTSYPSIQAIKMNRGKVF